MSTYTYNHQHITASSLNLGDTIVAIASGRQRYDIVGQFQGFSPRGDVRVRTSNGVLHEFTRDVRQFRKEIDETLTTIEN